jgi:HD-like signal output (HDOD) protein
VDNSSVVVETSLIKAHDSDGIIVEEGEAAVAFMFLRSLATEVSKGQIELPCFPDVLIRIRRALSNPNTTLAQLARIIEVEPVLATRLIATANAALFNPSGRLIRDLPLAMTRLGEQQVQSITVAYSMQQVTKVKLLQPIAKELNQLWHRNIGVAVLAKMLAPRVKVHPDTAFLTGLLSGIGKLYILTRAMELYPQLTRQQDFFDTVGGWHASIGKEVLTDWGFAAEALAVGNQDDFTRTDAPSGGDLSDVLIASAALTDALLTHEALKDVMARVASFKRLDLLPNTTADVMEQAKSQLQATYLALNI